MAIKQKTKSLKSRHSQLHDTMIQLDVLNRTELEGGDLERFDQALLRNGVENLQPMAVTTLQINVGKLCNQSCAHCHVDAGPDRTEVMSKDTLESCLGVLSSGAIQTVDITGGAPEMNPHFRWFVSECHKLGLKIMNRCNLTIIESNPRFHDLPEFFAKHGVHLVSSLPHYSKLRTDNQRGQGVFDDSVKALKKLNTFGYGIDGSGLLLDLVYNPTGAFLPSSQEQLEADFKSQLDRRYGIQFNQLYAITNLPISRFLEYLIDTEQYAEYMTRLISAFNPATIDGLMCRNTISVGWDGYLFDCDFNQMLDMKVQTGANHISNFDTAALANRTIAVNQHCYGCTAGAGSSCGGEIV